MYLYYAMSECICVMMFANVDIVDVHVPMCMGIEVRGQLPSTFRVSVISLLCTQG